MLNYDNDSKSRNLRQYKGTFSLIVEQILAFGYSINLAGEVNNLPPNFKQIA